MQQTDNAIEDLNDQLLQLLCLLQEKYKILPRHLKIRVEKWATRLSEPTLNLLWKRDNVAYARILLQAVITRVGYYLFYL